MILISFATFYCVVFVETKEIARELGRLMPETKQPKQQKNGDETHAHTN